MPHDWRDSLRLAADLALLGILVTLAALPVVTAGAAVGTGSAALHKLLTCGRWPTAAECWSLFRSSLARGWWAGPFVLVAAWLIAIDVAALNRGAVPGGRPLAAALLVLACLGAGYAAVVAGVSGGSQTHAVRRAAALATARPATLPATTGVVLLAVLLAALIHPVLVPVLAGYVLFAVHAVLQRLAPGHADAKSPGAVPATGRATP